MRAASDRFAEYLQSKSEASTGKLAGERVLDRILPTV